MPSSCGESAMLLASPSPPGVIPLPMRLGSILPADESIQECLARGSNICSSPLLLSIALGQCAGWFGKGFERLSHWRLGSRLAGARLVVMGSRACLWMDNRCERSVFVRGRQSVRCLATRIERGIDPLLTPHSFIAPITGEKCCQTLNESNTGPAGRRPFSADRFNKIRYSTIPIWAIWTDVSILNLQLHMSTSAISVFNYETTGSKVTI